MSKKAFHSITAGLEDALAYAKGNTRRGHGKKIRRSDVDVASLRERLKLSQDEFATAFDMSLGTVRNWEQGRRKPDGPAAVLLKVIEKAPRTVLRAIWTVTP